MSDNKVIITAEQLLFITNLFIRTYESVYYGSALKNHMEDDFSKYLITFNPENMNEVCIGCPIPE